MQIVIYWVVGAIGTLILWVLSEVLYLNFEPQSWNRAFEVLGEEREEEEGKGGISLKLLLLWPLLLGWVLIGMAKGKTVVIQMAEFYDIPAADWYYAEKAGGMTYLAYTTPHESGPITSHLILGGEDMAWTAYRIDPKGQRKLFYRGSYNKALDTCIKDNHWRAKVYHAK